MTNDELKVFKTMFDKYCRHQINNGYCEGDTCEWCSIHKAYEEVEEFEKQNSIIIVHIFNIEWDTDGEKVDLPTEVIHPFKGYNDINDYYLECEISDWLSNEYGFCHKGFMIKEEE